MKFLATGKTQQHQTFATYLFTHRTSVANQLSYHCDLFMDLAKKIKALRVSLSLTQKEFAEKLSCATISIQSYEANRKNPNGLFMQKLCNQFPQYTLWLMTDIDVSTIKNKQIKE